MTNTTKVLRLTSDAVVFSIQEFFRPLRAIPGLLKSRGDRSQHPASDLAREASLEEAQAILRYGLAERRHQERLLVTQCVLSAFASLLAVAISLLGMFQSESILSVAIVALISSFTVWVAFRVVRNREKIVELKTVYRLMKSIDRDTAERVVKQIAWGKPKEQGTRRKHKNRR